MTPNIIRSIFNKIPNIKNKSTIMEFHMVEWSVEQLDVLAEYNFTTVIAGVQTFDNEYHKDIEIKCSRIVKEGLKLLDFYPYLSIFIIYKRFINKY